LLVVVLLGSALFCVAQEKVTFDGHKVLRFSIRNEDDRNVILHLVNQHNLDLWAATPEWLDVHVAPAERFVFDQVLVPFHEMIEDLQAVIDEPPTPTVQVAGADPFFNAYRNLDEFTKFFNDLAQKYPQLVTKKEIGRSLEQRQIFGIKITSDKKPTGKLGIVYNGGQHAREWISPMTMAWIANELLSRYGNDPIVTRLVDEFEWTIVPVLNPDGYVYTWTTNRMWRKNRRPGARCYGVDNNRNWDFHWNEGGSSNDPCNEAYHGPSPFSEPEEKAIAEYIKAQGNVKGYIDFHAYSQLWMIPWGYTNRNPPDYTLLMQGAKVCVEALTRVFGTQYRYGPISTTIYPASGSSVDWVYGAANVTFSFAVEGRDTGRYGFVLPPAQIVPSGEENMAAVLAMGNFILSRKSEL